jgi:hypothetical protein
MSGRDEREEKKGRQRRRPGRRGPLDWSVTGQPSSETALPSAPQLPSGRSQCPVVRPGTQRRRCSPWAGPAGLAPRGSPGPRTTRPAHGAPQLRPAAQRIEQRDETDNPLGRFRVHVAAPTNGAGEARVLPDAAGAPVRVWRSGDTSGIANENITQQAFDVLRRPTEQTFTQGTASPRVVELRRTGERGGAPERPLAPADQGSGPGAQPPQSATWECPPRQPRPIAPRDPRPPRGGT